MKQLIKLLFIVSLTVFCFSMPLLAEEGVTDTEIHIGQWGPQTGPAAPWGAVARGADAYFKMINAEGGIHGRKIIHHYFDDAYNPAKTKAGVKKLQESDHSIFAWVGGVGTATGMAVKQYLVDRKIPWISPSTGSKAWIVPPSRYIFGLYPQYDVEAAALTKFAIEDLKTKRIAMIYQNDEYGENALEGFQRQLKEAGMEPAVVVPWNLGDNDLKPHINRLKKSGADTVLIWVTPGTVVRILFTAKTMQFNPQWMSTSTVSDYPFMYKISRGLYEGVITATFGLTIDSDNPLMKKYKREAFDKFAAKDERWGVFYTAGMGYAEPLVEALRRVGRDLTRERLIEEMENLRGFKGILAEVNYAPFDPNDPGTRQGLTSIKVIQCLKDAKTKELTGWITPKTYY